MTCLLPPELNPCIPGMFSIKDVHGFPLRFLELRVSRRKYHLSRLDVIQA